MGQNRDKRRVDKFATTRLRRETIDGLGLLARRYGVRNSRMADLCMAAWDELNDSQKITLIKHADDGATVEIAVK